MLSEKERALTSGLQSAYCEIDVASKHRKETNLQ